MAHDDETWRELQLVIERRVTALMDELRREARCANRAVDRDAMERKIESFRKAFLGASASSQDLAVRGYVVEEVAVRLKRQLR